MYLYMDFLFFRCSFLELESNDRNKDYEQINRDGTYVNDI